MTEQTVRAMRISDLTTYHANPNKGNIPAIAESLRVNGQYRPIVVNVGTGTGRPFEILAGNHTYLAAKKLGWSTIEVVTVDVDDDGATRIVAADNRTAELADMDDRALAELLATLDDLEGTGYTPVDLDDLARALNDMTDTSEPEAEASYKITIECGNATEQARVMDILERYNITAKAK